MRNWKEIESAEYFVQTYADMILRICIAYGLSKEDGFDLCQNIYIKLFEKNLSFATIEQERAYLRKMAVNACKDLRKSWHFKTRSSVEMQSTIQSLGGEYEKMETLEILRSLPMKYREVIYFCCIDGLSCEETAVVLGKTVSCVRKRLSRARKMIEREMGGIYVSRTVE